MIYILYVPIRVPIFCSVAAIDVELLLDVVHLATTMSSWVQIRN